jgi:hypothetical protein
VAVLSKVCVCRRWLAGIAGSDPTGGMDVGLFGVLRVVYETGRSLVQGVLSSVCREV